MECLSPHPHLSSGRFGSGLCLRIECNNGTEHTLDRWSTVKAASAWAGGQREALGKNGSKSEHGPLFDVRILTISFPASLSRMSVSVLALFFPHTANEI